jgi:hypothetical protein
MGVELIEVLNDSMRFVVARLCLRDILTGKIFKITHFDVGFIQSSLLALSLVIASNFILAVLGGQRFSVTA